MPTSTPATCSIYVARGALDVDLDGTVHELEEGDAVVFDGATPHRLRRRGSPSTRALISQGLKRRSAGGSPPASSVSAPRCSAAIASPSGPGP